jgi:alpha-L-rhamnosidase
MNSHDHPMLGSIGAWLYKQVAGLRVDEAAPGWKRVIVRPHPMGDLKWVEARQETIAGTVGVKWKIGDKRLEVEVEIPAGSEGSVELPLVAEYSKVSEGGKVIWEKGKAKGGVEGIGGCRMAGGRLAIATGSGTYRFTAEA